MVVAKRAAAPVKQTVNFGDDSIYSSGFQLPEGDYLWKSVDVLIHEGFGEKKGNPRLGVMLTLTKLEDPEGEEFKSFYSMGSKAMASFAPDPDTGKGIVPVPGGPAITMPGSTNWNILRKSLYDCGLPAGIFSDDVSVLEGIHAHMRPIPEPEERKGFGAKTGEVEEQKRNGTILVVAEIKDDGKPWEGTGGLVAPAAPAAKKAAPVAAKKAAPAPVEEEAGTDDEALQTAAVNGMSAVLEKSPKGVSKLLLRTGTFKAVSASDGADVAQAVIDTFFGSDDTLNGPLGSLGFVVKGSQIAPQA